MAELQQTMEALVTTSMEEPRYFEAEHSSEHLNPFQSPFIMA